MNSGKECWGNKPHFNSQYCIERKGVEAFSHIGNPSFSQPGISGINPNMPVAMNQTVNHNLQRERRKNFSSGHCNHGDNSDFAAGTDNHQRHWPQWQDNMAKEDSLAWTWPGAHRMLDQMKLCKMFHSGRKCVYGDNCRFWHSIPETSKQNLGQIRGSLAIRIGMSGYSRDYNSGSDQFEHKRSDTSGIVGDRVNQKPVGWKTKLCNAWGRTGFCRYGNMCNYAHGLAELQKPGRVAFESLDFPANAFKTSPTVKDAIQTSSEQKEKENKSTFKFKELERNSSIYADWI